MAKVKFFIDERGRVRSIEELEDRFEWAKRNIQQISLYTFEDYLKESIEKGILEDAAIWLERYSDAMERIGDFTNFTEKQKQLLATTDRLKDKVILLEDIVRGEV